MFVECYRAALKRPLEEKSQQRGQTVCGSEVCLCPEHKLLSVN